MTQGQFVQLIDQIAAKIDGVRGWLTDREVGMLATLAACPTAEGEILEIGTYRGLSAIVLAVASEQAESPRITLLDPLCHPNEAENLLDAAKRELEENLAAAGVSDRVDIRIMTSQEFLPKMDRKLRLLWIDGDHEYEGSSFDMHEYSQFIVDGGIIACHDILSPNGCTQAFKELVVENPHFGPVGFCGSIGWAQFHEDTAKASAYTAQKQTISSRLAPLCRLTEKAQISKLYRSLYRLHRRRIPHGDVSPSNWVLREN